MQRSSNLLHIFVPFFNISHSWIGTIKISFTSLFWKPSYLGIEKKMNFKKCFDFYYCVLYGIKYRYMYHSEHVGIKELKNYFRKSFPSIHVEIWSYQSCSMTHFKGEWEINKDDRVVSRSKIGKFWIHKDTIIDLFSLYSL